MFEQITVRDSKGHLNNIGYFSAANERGVSRKTEITEVGPFTDLETQNRFIFYQQAITLSPHIFIPLLKMSLQLVKGFRITGKDAGKVEEFKLWADMIGLREKIRTMSRLLVRDGTYVALITDNSYELFDFEPLLLSQTTILPKGYKSGDQKFVLLQPPADKFVVNEGVMSIEKKYNLEQVIYGAIYPRDNVVKDIIGRDTFGLYGQSMIDPIKDLLYKYLKLIEGYCSFIDRYGSGRYHINYTALADLIKDGEVDAAIEALDKLTEKHATIQQNEDIIGAGFEIKELALGGSNINVTEFKESLEKDIQIGLLQAPLTMGRAEGTTFAAGYVSEEDRMVALEGIQNILKDVVNKEVIGKRLALQGGLPGDVVIEFEELSKPKVDSKDLNDAVTKDLISIEEWRARSGFPPERNPNEMYMSQLSLAIQDAQLQLQMQYALNTQEQTSSNDRSSISEEAEGT